MKPKVFIGLPIPIDVQEYIGKYCDYRMWNDEGIIPYNLLMKEVKDIDGLLIVKRQIDAQLLEEAPNLKIVSNMSVGFENFNLGDMRTKNVIGTNTPNVLDETVADLVIGLMIGVSRKIVNLDQLVRTGGWTDENDTPNFGLDIHHKKIGIVGMGRIGEQVAIRAKFGFHMDVMYYSRSRKPELENKLQIQYVEFESLLKQSDFIVVLTSLTPQTEKMIGRKEFSLMKKEAIFINAARGGVVDESALIDALNRQTISGAGLDVFEKEPIDLYNPLLLTKNTILTPHIGSATSETRHKMAKLAAENLIAGVLGFEPPNIVT